jgi:N-acetylmuramoyl-L-alanine amidase
MHWRSAGRWCLLLLFAGWAMAAEAAVIGGRNYTSLADWAAANGLKLARMSEDTFVVAGRTTRLVFEKDSHAAEINGVKVALSFPVAMDKGVIYISQFDLVKTVGPLTSTPNASPKKLTTICLDPGHGGKDTGNRVGGRNEKTYTLLLAQELRDQLQKAGFRVFLTRSKDVFVDLPTRPALADQRKADLFVSLHFNGTPMDASRVNGVETYCITPYGAASSNAQGEGASHGPTVANGVEKKSLWLAYQVQKSVTRNCGANDRSVRRARFAVLRDAEMPAILVESGYLSHPVEGRKIADPEYRRQIAAGIVKGIQGYQKLYAPPAPTPPLQPARPSAVGPVTTKKKPAVKTSETLVKTRVEVPMAQ